MFSIVKKVIISFGNLNIFHWLIISTLIWFFIYRLYFKFIKILLNRVGVNIQDQKPLIETIWRLCFTAISVPVVLSCVGVNVVETVSVWGGWVNRLDYQLSKCKIHEDVAVQGVKTVFVLHSSFSSHDFINTWCTKGFKNLEFLQKQLFLIVFILTYYSKCPLLGLSMLFLLHRSSLFELLSKLSCLLSHFTRSVSLGYVAKAFCGYYLILWCWTFLYTLPAFLSAGKTIDSHMMKAELKMLIILDFLLWLYVSVSLFSSMFTRVMLSLTISSHDRPRTLEYFLFGCEPWLLKLTRQTPKRLSEEELMNVSENAQKKAAKALIQTIRCAILLKRKIKRMRQEKARNLMKAKGKEQNSENSVS